MIDEDDVIWAIKTFTSLAIGGTWHLQGVGVYERTAEDELTMIEIHHAKPTEESKGLFESHEYLNLLANELGWKMRQQVRKAYDYEGKEMNIPEDRIGEANVCSKNCGTIVRIEPTGPGKVHALIEKGGICPICSGKGFGKDWDGVWVIVDDTGARLKMLAKMEEE